MQDIGKIFAENLKLLRSTNNMTQIELAEKLGVTQMTVNRWEKEHTFPPPKKITEIAELYSVEPFLLFCPMLQSPTLRNPTDAEVLLSIAEKYGINIKIKHNAK